MTELGEIPIPEDSLDFDFTELDDKEFELHLLHHGVEQPDNITGPDQLRTKGVVLCGKLVEAAHGNMKHPKRSIHNKTAEADEPCTLVIFEWYVHTTKPDRRIKFARIDIRFKSVEEGARSHPWVKGCAPHGTYSLFETEKTLETTKSWRPTVRLGQEGIAGFESPFVYEVKEAVRQTEHIFVDGCPLPPSDGLYSHPDRFSAVQWNLFENKGQRSGIPRYFRTAVLLNRSDTGNARFAAEVTIKVRVSTLEDARERVKGFLGRNVKDDDLMFNPTLPPKTDRFDDKLEDLGSGVILEDEMGFLLFKKPANAPPESKTSEEGEVDPCK